MLYLIATPIGNLGDITIRALEALKSADLIAAEDTRHSLILLRRYEIEKPLVSYHQHNEAMRTAELVQRLKDGASVAVITDAGMPGISDPGHRLLSACIEQKLPYTVIPGPSAVLTALVGSGFNTERFFYGGFLPTKSGQREREILAAGRRPESSIFFESPYRLVKSLELFKAHFPSRELCVARELTKQFEEFRVGTGAELAEHYTKHPPKGEICLVVQALSKQEIREQSPGEGRDLKDPRD